MLHPRTRLMMMKDAPVRAHGVRASETRSSDCSPALPRSQREPGLFCRITVPIVKI